MIAEGKFDGVCALLKEYRQLNSSYLTELLYMAVNAAIRKFVSCFTPVHAEK